ncbi:MAG: hypothetical protein FJ206_01025 [Gemmatimonadetes bacterium]|nr:hypothetical protein [Gemmatimonadota bacterium]
MPRFSMLMAAALAAAGSLAAQSGRVPRTPDGKPDLQGNWSNATLTPIERPAGRGPTLTAQEAAIAEGRTKARTDSLSRPSDPNRGAPAKGGVSLGDPRLDAASGGTGGYNVFFIDGGDRIAVVNGEARSSLITRPANGRVPPRTGQARERLAAMRTSQFGPYDNPENRPLAERCILSFGSNAGPPMLPNYFYNNNYTIVQTPGMVVILTEMVHDARMIRIGDGPRLPQGITPYMGDSWGRWVGDTLVIETSNIHPAQAVGLYGMSSKARVTERLVRTDERTILYSFTIDDPETFTEPWGGEVPFNRLDARVYEYACHEGNYALANVLSGARDEERRKATEEKKP